MFDLLLEYALICIAMLIIGFTSVKLSIYGLLTTVVLWVCYLLTPGLDSATVWSTMMPRFIDLWLFYPMFIHRMLDLGWADYGALGAGLYALVAILPVIPYVSGVVSGFIFWPELALLRIVF